MKPVVILIILGSLAPVSPIWAAQTQSTASATVNLKIESFSSAVVRPINLGDTGTTGGPTITPTGFPPGTTVYGNTIEITGNKNTLLTIPKQIIVMIDPKHTVVVHLSFVGVGFTTTQDATHWYLHLLPGSYGTGPPGPYIRLIAMVDPRFTSLHWKAGSFPLFPIDRNSVFAKSGSWYQSITAARLNKTVGGPYWSLWTFHKKITLPQALVDALVASVVQISPEP